MLVLSVKEWTRIRKRLQEEYRWKPSVFLIREVMQRELGFLPRYHREYTEESGNTETVHLDFYNAEAESFFVLKYL
jgi:hypothetical protein